MSAPHLDAVRIYAKIRTAHLERFREMVPAEVIYHRTSYDFHAEAADVPVPLHQVSRRHVPGRLLRTPYRVVEVNEPTWVRRWPDLFAQILAVRLGGLVRRRRTLIVAYCIGHADPAQAVRSLWKLPAPLARVVARLGMALLVRSLDRMAFGTTGSMALYGRYAGRRAVAARARLFEALPAPCDCASEGEPDRRTVVFLGRFDDRKGIRPLMCAWDVLRVQRPDLRLRLLGKGEHLAEVSAWAGARDEVELLVDPSRRTIHEVLRGASVSVLLSQRVGPWREQVGLPIVEALAHGVEVIATTETGLAGWLAAHGHAVLGPDAPADEVARVVAARADAARPRACVLGDLPTSDQRLAADEWLLTGAVVERAATVGARSA